MCSRRCRSCGHDVVMDVVVVGANHFTVDALVVHAVVVDVAVVNALAVEANHSVVVQAVVVDVDFWVL